MIIESFDNKAPQIDPTAFVARGAALVGELTLGPHSSVWYNATLRADLAAIRIGAYSNVQDNACIHVEAGGACTVGAHVTIGHCATLHACTVEDDVLIGMGAIVLDGAVIGRGSIVGAHALVTKNTQVTRTWCWATVGGRTSLLSWRSGGIFWMPSCSPAGSAR